jgi:hypothetical protein
MKIWRKLTKAYQLGVEKSWRRVWLRLLEIRREQTEAKNYQKWIKKHQLTDAKRSAIKREIENFTFKPLISVVMPVYNVEEKWLRLCIE